MRLVPPILIGFVLFTVACTALKLNPPVPVTSDDGASPLVSASPFCGSGADHKKKFDPQNIRVLVCNKYGYSINAIEIVPHSTCSAEVFKLQRPDVINAGGQQELVGDMAGCDAGRRVLLEFFADYPQFGSITYFCGLEITPRRQVKYRLWYPIKDRPALTECSFDRKTGVFTYDAHAGA